MEEETRGTTAALQAAEALLLCGEEGDGATSLLSPKEAREVQTGAVRSGDVSRGKGSVSEHAMVIQDQPRCPVATGFCVRCLIAPEDVKCAQDLSVAGNLLENATLFVF